MPNSYETRGSNSGAWSTGRPTRVRFTVTKIKPYGSGFANEMNTLLGHPLQ